MTGRVALVTGASRGIGSGIARALLGAGHRVAFGYRSRQEGAIAQTRGNPMATALPIDVTCRKSIQGALDACRARFGEPVGILVNNGAIAQEKPFLDLTEQDWDMMMATNLRGPFLTSQEAIPSMLEKGWGRIVNIVSVGGQWGGVNQVHYAAAKAGLINLTRSLARLYSGRGITANAVSPGLVATDMTRCELASPEGRRKAAAIPAGRIGTSEDVAAAVCFLCSEQAGHITGHTLNVNGGMYFG